MPSMDELLQDPSLRDMCAITPFHGMHRPDLTVGLYVFRANQFGGAGAGGLGG